MPADDVAALAMYVQYVHMRMPRTLCLEGEDGPRNDIDFSLRSRRRRRRLAACLSSAQAQQQQAHLQQQQAHLLPPSKQSDLLQSVPSATS